jgi:hypothetical protein
LGKSVVPNFSAPKPNSPTTSHAEPAKEEGRRKKEEKGEDNQLAPLGQTQAKLEITEPAGLDLSVSQRGAAIPAAGSGSVSPIGGALGGTPAEPAAGTVAPPEKTAKPDRWGSVAGWVRQWMPWGKESPFQRPAIQTELALDKVKVMRNDLSETDLEVVAIKIKAGKKNEKPVPTVEVEREKQTAQT